jgi:hypothetical protein
MIFIYFSGFDFRASVAVDFSAKGDFDDLRGGPGHAMLPFKLCRYQHAGTYGARLPSASPFRRFSAA